MPASEALTAGNLTALRAGNDHVKRYLAYVPKTQVATARAAQASFPNPNGGFLVDNTSANWADIKKGMTVWIGTTEGGREIGVYRLREDSDPTTILLGQVSLGDPGLLALSSLDELEDNAYITVWQSREIWSVFPSIEYSGGVDARSGTFLKDHDETYSNQNETVPAFALNVGAHRAATIDGSDIVTFEFTADADYSFVAATVSSYLWDVGDGTIIVGTSASQTITATFPAGYREISCTVTLDTGAVRTVYRSVWGRDPADNANHLDVQILSDRRGMLGRVMRFRAFDPLSALEDGQMALYWEEPDWNGNDVDSATKQCVGWLRSVSGTRDPDSSWREFELVSAMHVLAELKANSQQMVVTADPDNWQEVIAGLSHVDYWIFYLLNYHTTILDLFDYEIANLTTYLAKAWQVGVGSWASMLNQAGARINCSAGQRSDGTIFVRRNPQLMNQTDRDAVIERMTLTEVDLGAIPVNRTMRPRVGKVRGSAFAFDGSSTTPYLAVAPGNVGGQNASENELPDQLVTASGGQSELNERTANEFARLQNPYETISVPLPLNYDVFEPCEQYWVRLTVGASYWPEGAAFNRRCLVRAVTVNHEEDAKNLTIELEAETSGIGAPATTVPIVLPSSDQNAGFVEGNSFFPNFTSDSLTGLPTFQYNPYQSPNYASPPAPLPDTAYMMAGGNKLWISNQRGAASPAWSISLDPGSGWEITDFIHAAGSTASNLRMCAIAQNYTTNVARIYYNGNVTGSGTWVLKQAFEDVWVETIHHVAGEANGWAIKALSQAGGPTNDELHHTDDNWDSYNTITISATSGDPRFDVDDFDLGIFVAGKGAGEVWYTTAYTDASMTALTGITANGSAEIRFVRIPYRKVLTQADNDDPAALMVIIGSLDALGGETIWAVTFDSTDGSIVNEENLTPMVSATTYYGRSRYSFSAAGGNSQNMLLSATVAGSTTPTKLLLSEDGATSWDDIGSDIGDPHWLDGSSTQVIFAKGGNIKLSEDKGVTTLNQTGDLSDASANKALIIPD